MTHRNSAKRSAEDFELELQARDELIEHLNQQLAELRLAARPSNSSNVDQQLKETLEALAYVTQEKAEVTEFLQSLETKYRVERAAWLDDKDKLQLAYDDLKHDHAAAAGQVTAKEQQLREAQQDMRDLALIIEQLKLLNKELQKKVQAQHEHIQELRNQCYEVRTEAQQVAGLQVKLAEALALTQVADTKLATMNNVIAVTQAAFARFAASIESAAADLDVVMHSLSRVPGNVDLIEPLRQIRAAMKFKNPAEARAFYSKTYEVQIFELHESLNEKSQELEVLKAKVQPLQLHSDSLTAQLKQEISEHAVSRQSASQRIEAVIKRNEELRTEVSTARSASYAAEADSLSAQKKAESVQTRLLTAQQRITQLEVEVKELTQALHKTKTTYAQAEQEMSALKQSDHQQSSQVSKLKATVKVLQDQVAQKDLQLLQARKEFFTLQEEHQALIAQSAHAADQEKIASLGKQLIDKEQQVAVLKDMLSSTRCEVKQKGIDLARVQLVLRKKTSPKRVLNKKV